MATKKKIVRGCIAQDPITGLVGTVGTITEFLSGTVQASLIPKAKGTELGKTLFVDIERLVWKSKGIPSTAVDDTSHIELGAVMEDVVTGFKGTAVYKSTHINGCTSVILQPKVDPKKSEKWPEAIDFDWKRLKLSGEVVKMVEAPRQTGCISTPFARQG